MQQPNPTEAKKKKPININPTKHNNVMTPKPKLCRVQFRPWPILNPEHLRYPLQTEADLKISNVFYAISFSYKPERLEELFTADGTYVDLLLTWSTSRMKGPPIAQLRELKSCWTTTHSPHTNVGCPPPQEFYSTEPPGGN